jgi:hypothetical protein
LINDVSVQVEVGGACLCDSTAAPPLLDIATVAITDYYNSYVSSAFFIGHSVDIEMVTGYRHVCLSICGASEAKTGIALSENASPRFSIIDHFLSFPFYHYFDIISFVNTSGVVRTRDTSKRKTL